MSPFAKFVRYSLTTLFLLVVILRSAAQPSWLTELVQIQLDQIAPGTAIVGNVVIDNSGRLNIQDLEIQDHGVPLAIVSNLRITPNWWDLLQGDIAIDRIDCEEVHVRFVRDKLHRSRWQALGKRIGSQTTSKSPSSSSTSLTAFGPLSIRHLNLVAENPRGGLFTFLNLDATKLSIDLNHEHIHIGGLVHSEIIDPVMGSFSANKQGMRIMIQSDHQHFDPRLLGAMPEQLRKQLKPWTFSGSFATRLELHSTRNDQDRQELEITPLEIEVTPPHFNVPIHVYEGKLALDKTGREVVFNSLGFEVRGDDGRPIANGQLNGLGPRMHLKARINRPDDLALGLPPRLQRIFTYTNPNGPFEIEWFRHNRSQSVEARFANLSFTGMQPSLINTVGVVSCDFPAVGAPHGVAEFSDLECLGLRFTRVTVPFVDDGGLELGPGNTLIAAGPRAHVSGSLKAIDGSIKGALHIRGIDLRSWIHSRSTNDDMKRLNGVLNGTLKLDAAKGAPHDATIGTLDFQIEEAEVKVSSNWLPVIRLIKKPTDLLTLPIRALGGRTAEDFDDQIIRGGKGRLILNPNKMIVDALLIGDPFNFEVDGKVRFSNQGELKFKPVLLTRYDPTILLMDLVPIVIKWPTEDATDKP